jgi:ubiquinone/menaquinone biosynthesis C-methylase UbiE
LHDLAGEYLQSGDTVLDAGCRDAEHLIQLVHANDVSGVGIDPVEIHIERARAAVSAAGLDQRITLHRGVMHDLPFGAEYFDFVWCRDVLEQVDDLDGALVELTRTMKADARLLVYTTFVTDRLEGRDAEMMQHSLGNVEKKLHPTYVEIRVQTCRARN